MGPYGITLEKDWNLFFGRAAALRSIQSIHWSTLLRWILHQWILQIQNRHCFVGFCISGFCKYTAHTASLDFAPLFVRAQLRQSHTLHKPFILIWSHSIHWSLQYDHPCQYCWSNPCSKGRYVSGGFIIISDWDWFRWSLINSKEAGC